MLLLALLVLGGIAVADNQDTVSVPVSVAIEPSTQDGVNANSRPVSVAIEPGTQDGVNANSRPVSVVIEPGTLNGVNANSRPVSVAIEPGYQDGVNATSRPVSVKISPDTLYNVNTNSRPVSVVIAPGTQDGVNASSSPVSVKISPNIFYNVNAISRPVSVMISPDTVAPDAPSFTNYSAMVGTSSVTVYGTKTADATTIIVFLNNTSIGPSAVDYPQDETAWSAVVSGLAPGTNTIKARAKDLAGNESGDSGSIEVYYDNAPPGWLTQTGVRFVEPADGQAFVRWNTAQDAIGGDVSYNVFKSMTTLGYTAEEKVNVSSSEPDPDGYEFQYTLTGLDNNRDYNVAVRAVDRFGNEDTNTVVLRVRPQMASAGAVVFSSWTGVSLPEGMVTTQPEGYLTATAANNPVEYTSELIDLGESTLSTVSYNVINAGQGVTTLSVDNGDDNFVTVTDGQQTSLPTDNQVRYKVSFSGYSTTYPVLKSVSLGYNDFVPPAMAVIGSYPTLTNYTSLLFAGTKDAGSSIWINGLQAVPSGSATDWQVTVDIDNEGANNIDIFAADDAGNTSQTTSFSISRDTVAPATPTVDPVDPTSTVANLALSGTKDTGSGIYINGDVVVPADASGTWTHEYLLVDGSNTLNIYSFDDAGNFSYPVMPAPVVVFDTTLIAPSLVSKSYTYTRAVDNVVVEQPSTVGQGVVAVDLLVSEELAETPFFSISPSSGSPIVVPLVDAGGLHWTGQFQLTSQTANGQTTSHFSAKDLDGNRVNVEGEGPIIDVKGPGATIMLDYLVRIPDQPGQPLNFDVDFDENTEGAIILELVDSSGIRSPVQMDAKDGGFANYSGTVDIYGLPTGEATFDLVTSMDVFGNVGTTINSGGTIWLYTDQDLPPPPPVPAGLAAAPAKGGIVNLTWEPAEKASAYWIYRSTVPADSSPVALTTDPVPDTGFVDNPGSDGTYYYTVSSVGPLGAESGRSAEVEAVSDGTPPDVPSDIQLSFGAAGVSVSWTAPSGGPASYNVYRSSSDITTTEGLTPIKTGLTGTAWDDPSPDTDNRVYAVTALDEVGNESSPSLSGTAVFSVAPVKNLTFSKAEGEPPHITWEQPQNGLQGYILYRNGVKLTSTPVQTLSYVDTAYSGGNVTYGVSAVDSYGEESPLREVAYSGFSVGVAPGLILHRGILENIQVVLSNPGTTDISVESIQMGIGTEPTSMSYGPYDVPAGSVYQVDIVGAAGLDAQSPVDIGLTASWSPSPGVTVNISNTVQSDVEGAGGSMEIFCDPLVKGGQVNARLKVYNTGDALMEFVTREAGGPSSQVFVRLKDLDGNTLGQGNLYQWSGAGIVNVGSDDSIARIAPGESVQTADITFTVPENAPELVTLEAVITSTYYHYGYGDVVMAPGITRSVQMTVGDAPYRAVASVDGDTFLQAQPVEITGYAISNTTEEYVPYEPVTVWVSVRGFDRSFSVYSDAQGAFSYTFTPAPEEAGVYTVWASHPDVAIRSVQDSFTIAGMSVRPSSVDLTMVRGTTFDVPLTLENTGENQLTNIVRVISDGTGLGAVEVNNMPSALNPGQTANCSLSVSTTSSTPDSVPLTVEFQSAEGAAAKVDVNVLSVTMVPLLTASPSFVDTGVMQGTQKTVSITLTNNGAGPLENARVEGPSAVSWLSLSTDRAIGDIAPGESSTIVLALNPEATVELGQYYDSLLIASDNHTPFGIPVIAVVTDSATGCVAFSVSDVLGGNVQGAQVRLQIPGTIDYLIQDTDANGYTMFSDISAGSYNYAISAQGYDPYSGVVEVSPGTTWSEAVVLMNQFVTFEFEVEPTTIQDEYDIVVTQTFVTNVPVPVLVVEPYVINLPVMESGDVYQGEYTMSNYGLIAIENMYFNAPSFGGDYTMELLYEFPDTLRAMETITVPFRIIKK